ncbi:lipoate--protein ligase family protein [Salisediminibacterium selenitireducens]|uniref:Octanoyl-[GcvH]:protein N-octanoyltransferase n=1 Tax=Bacillus selenitireducens (strain ATCC 700615 / DSM 15326 / MLS10) TaxID=439292 RepID=D6Y1B3_BACIE|nr:lipoate--protein ligase family protein [Salisediminibacterium selenitireducens]ADI00700.1 biotin/lipoate A/B protein ligase [[Bacillus] selenitireducens MLS10]
MMNELDQRLYRERWYWIDHTNPNISGSAMKAFAMDDTLCQIAGTSGNQGFARGWVHRPTVVLGIQDTRLPSVQDGIRFLRKQGYDVIARNSGGLAVVLDEGVYNLSLVFSEEPGLSIDRGYAHMVDLIRQLFPEAGKEIEDGEIATSYCPGRYDLSIADRKFAGISQRRIRGGIAVQIYLAVTGSGSERAALIRDFYGIATKGGPVKFDVPHIQPDTMASLEELITGPVRINEVTRRVLGRLTHWGDELSHWEMDEEAASLYETHLGRIQKRNDDFR